MKNNKEEKYHQALPGLDDLLEEASEDTASSETENLNPIDYYVIEERIATGGLKDVWRARDRRTGRFVALAKLKPELNFGHNNERFLMEAKILSQLEHTSIVPLYDFNYDNNSELFFTMKLLSGEHLASVLKQLKKNDAKYREDFPLRVLLDIFVRICDAISYAHAKGIVHLDLKPENIQISDYSEFSVIDWGMAKQMDMNIEPDSFDVDLPKFQPLFLSENSNIISGTPGYMAPEQANGKVEIINKSSDIYALGAILYAILYYHQPFDNLETKDVVLKTQEGASPDFPEKAQNENVPSALRAVAKKAMMPNQSDRYKNVASLKADIVRYMNDFATQAENINLIQLSHLFIKRHSKALTIALVFATIVSTITYVSYQEIRGKEKLLKAQNIKVDATADEIIRGTLDKHAILRSQHKFSEILSNYRKLKSVGYQYPDFWYDEARLLIGEANYKEALDYLIKINQSDSSIKYSKQFGKDLKHTKIVHEITKKRELKHSELIEFAINMDLATQKHIYWNINQDETVPMGIRIKNMEQGLIHHNKHLTEDNYSVRYSIASNHVSLDLSNERQLRQIIPLYGLPVDDLNISKTGINATEFKDYIKKSVSSINISSTRSNILNTYLDNSLFTRFVCRNSNFDADRIYKAPKLKYLDLEGSRIIKQELSGSASLEHLNIAFTDLKEFVFLTGYPSLKKLIIDQSKILPEEIRKKLIKSGVEIIIKEKSPLTIPGKIEAENYFKMYGIQTNKAYDIGGGQFVGWFDKGDSITYKIYATQSGRYKLTLRLAGRHFAFNLKTNNKQAHEVVQEGTSGWQDWQSLTREVHLPKGENLITLECIAEGWNINWLDFELLEN